MLLLMLIIAKLNCQDRKSIKDYLRIKQITECSSCFLPGVVPLRFNTLHTFQQIYQVAFRHTLWIGCLIGAVHVNKDPALHIPVQNQIRVIDDMPRALLGVEGHVIRALAEVLQ